ncbi:MAG: riboflavin biosynthesis protein RibF [Planctomycetota bacterium]
MKVLHGIEALGELPDGGALSIGNFDGVHAGHRAIIDAMRRERDVASVVTFEPHPATVLRPGQAPPRLTLPEMKREKLEAAGVTHLVELSPSPEVTGLTAEQFWHRLRDDARPAAIFEGANFRFGKQAAGDVAQLKQWASQTDITVNVVDQVSMRLPNLHEAAVSSTLVRWMLLRGRVCDAAALLGEAYVLRGRVVRGYQRGRTIGFPTANLDTGDQLLPMDGVYAATAIIDGERHAAALSVGVTPTFDGERRQAEAYLLNFDGDLYGQTIDVTLRAWVRGQMKFSGVDALVGQLKRDVEFVDVSAR